MSTSTTIRRAFADFDAEQKWLDRMSAEGRALVAYSGGSYTFAEDEPGAWSYAVEVVARDRKEAEAYLSFLEDAGIETVAVYAGRAYLRKRNGGRPLELHSDLASRLDQARRGGAVWTAVLVTQIPLALLLIADAFTGLFSGEGASDLAKGICLAMGIALAVAAVIEYVRLGGPYRRRIRQLKKELSIRE